MKGTCFFDMVRLVRLQCTKPEIKEFLAWFKSNVPSKFRKHEPASDKQGTVRQESGVLPITTAPLARPAEKPDEPTTSNTKPKDQQDFDVSKYNLDCFAKDATSLQSLLGEKNHPCLGKRHW